MEVSRLWWKICNFPTFDAQTLSPGQGTSVKKCHSNKPPKVSLATVLEKFDVAWCIFFSLSCIGWMFLMDLECQFIVVYSAVLLIVWWTVVHHVRCCQLSAFLTSLGNNGLCWTVFARNRDTAVPAEGNGNLQTLICVLVARPRRCLTYIVESCPLTKLNGGLSRLHSADEDAVSWLTSYGSWHAYEKKKHLQFDWIELWFSSLIFWAPLYLWSFWCYIYIFFFLNFC